MYILNTAAYYLEVESDVQNLKQEVKDSCGKHVRRVDRFIQLALIGSHRCALEFDLPKNTGLYLSSGDGPKTNIHNSLEQIYQHQQPLMPLNFINMVSNSASYYIAHSLGIQGANIFNSDDHFSIQNSLLLAELDLSTGTTDCALAGTIDEAAAPFDIQRKLLDADSDAPIGEGSYWLLLSKKPENAIGKLLCNQQSNNLNEICETIATLTSKDASAVICIEQSLNDSEQAELKSCIGQARQWQFQNEIAKHRCESAYAITEFFKKDDIKESLLIHISKDDIGNYALTIAEKSETEQ
jgi:hypothetical protein